MHRRTAVKCAKCVVLAWGVLSIAAGCAAVAPPAKEEVAAVERGDNALVLIRVVVESTDGTSHPPFEGELASDNIGIAVGGFETGGALHWIDQMRFLSPRSRAAGWFFMTLKPGTHYLAFLPPRRTDVFTYQSFFKKVARWRLDVPAQSPLVYGGTMVLRGDVKGLLFGGSYLANIQFMGLLDQTDEARAVARDTLPSFAWGGTSLMAPHQGPVILSDPVR